jgi:hypothetical protein
MLAVTCVPLQRQLSLLAQLLMLGGAIAVRCSGV